MNHPISVRRFAGLFVPALVVTVFLATSAWASSSGSETAGDVPSRIGVKLASAKEIKQLNKTGGKVRLVNFWATWCAPCKEELPVFNRLYEKYRLMGLEILGVSIDKSPSAAAEFGRRLGLNFPILFDPSGSLSEKYRITSMPSTAVVAKDGTIRYVHRGFLPSDPSNYDKEIRSLLKEGVQ